MELFLDLFTKMQYGIAFLAAGLLFVHWLRPKLIRFRTAIKAKAAAARRSVAEVASSRGPSISPMPSASRE
jgi:alkanesulfonate monooxygenase SsuD/methylene tetrahydromethanopterin reductase-like flavin-dependent oxidoreductase (luciferase family)